LFLAQDHADFGSNRSEAMNVIDFKNLERDAQISVRNLRKLDGLKNRYPLFLIPL
jgi:hypothetical protein